MVAIRLETLDRQALDARGTVCSDRADQRSHRSPQIRGDCAAVSVICVRNLLSKA